MLFRLSVPFFVVFILVFGGLVLVLLGFFERVWMGFAGRALPQNSANKTKSNIPRSLSLNLCVNLLDFCVILDGRGTIGIYDPEVGKNVPVGKIDMSKKLFLVGTIVECAYENGSWHALHDRPDKNQANDMLTFKKTRRNIDENIKFEEIVRFVHS